MTAKRTYKRVRPAQKAKALKLLAEGASTAHAARSAKMSRGALRNILYRRETPAKSVGRPKRLTPEQTAQLVAMASAGKRSLEALAADATQRFGSPVSRSTVGRLLRQKANADGAGTSRRRGRPRKSIHDDNETVVEDPTAVRATRNCSSGDRDVGPRTCAKRARDHESARDVQQTRAETARESSAFVDRAYQASATVANALQYCLLSATSTGSLLGVVYPFLNNYLHMIGTETASANALLSIPWTWRMLLPRQKAETQELKRTGGKSKLLGNLTIAYIAFAFCWSLMTNLMTFSSRTACLKIAGGDGC